MREIIESKAWAESAMELPVVLGVDSVTNKPVIQDLARMPHALIAGATGQGKSVCLNAIIVSLLYRCTPQDLRFIMVDPKVVELQIYNNLPHLLIPVETDPKRVPSALKWLIAEMSQRYKIFAKCGVKNITGFNAKLAKEAGLPKQEELPLSPEEQSAAQAAADAVIDDGVRVPTEKLPYIVCIIDEMADLMMVAAKDMETSVARIAQLARAAGIHLVLATQRPSTDVITGLIKANLPTRIAFKTTSQIDSRTILDAAAPRPSSVVVTCFSCLRVVPRSIACRAPSLASRKSRRLLSISARRMVRRSSPKKWLKPSKKPPRVAKGAGPTVKMAKIHSLRRAGPSLRSPGALQSRCCSVALS